MPASAASYDYLLAMPLSSLTVEKVRPAAYSCCAPLGAAMQSPAAGAVPCCFPASSCGRCSLTTYFQVRSGVLQRLC